MPSYIGTLANATASFNFLPDFGNLPAGSNVLAVHSGQSNWRSDPPTGSPYTGPQPTAQVWDGTSAFVAYNDQHDIYEPPFRNSLAFALEFNAQYPNLNLYVIEFGQGGQGFRNGAGAFADGGAVSTTLTSYLTAAAAALAGSQTSYYICGIFFWQGEDDAGDAGWSAAYQAEADAFFGRLDTAIGQTLHRFIVRIHPNTPGPGTATVRAAHAALADTLIDIDSFSTLPDNLHYSVADYETIGRSFVNTAETVALTFVDNSSAPPVDPEPVTMSFRSFDDIAESPAGTLTEINATGLGKGATSIDTFVSGDYVQFEYPSISAGTSWLVVFSDVDDSRYSNDGNQQDLVAIIPRETFYRRMPVFDGGAGTDVAVTLSGVGTIFRMYWQGDDVLLQHSDDNGVNFTTGHTYTGIMSGVTGDVWVKAYLGFSNGSKQLIDFKKGSITP